ncbi:hypothetical protein BX667DRAFT_536562 [Coemansia mojavensis]|nr:hypothetical protein BX667DRAFT_536562 [Coemansia mojavensis]
MFSTCELKIQTNFAKYYSTQSSLSLDFLYPYYNRFVRRLELCLNYRDILDAKELMKLDFPRAHFLKVKIEITGYLPLEHLSNSSFQIKGIIPNTNTVELAIDNLAYKKEIVGFHKLLEKMAGDFYVNLSLMEAVGVEVGDIKLQRLQCNWDDHWQSTLQLVHRNSDNLNELNLHCSHTYGLNMLSGNKSYPSLTIISLEANLNMNLVKVPAGSSPSPFPVLEFVYINFPYPFEDDVLLRGNIKHLQIYVNDHVLNMICKIPSTIRTITFLNTVSIKTSSSFKMFDRFIKLKLDNLYGLHINDVVAAKACYKVLQAYIDKTIDFPNIKYLRLKTPLTITKIVNILGCFSHLHVFSVEFQTADIDFRCLDLHQIYRTIKQKMKNANHCLKQLFLFYEQEWGYEGVSVLIVILAVLCPHLDRIYMDTIADFDLSAVEATLMDPYFKTRFATPEIERLAFKLINHKPHIADPRYIVLLQVMRNV